MSIDASGRETRFAIGAEARCTDGVCGEVTRVVIDPLLDTVTHLVVEPKHRSGLGRLVPLDLLDMTTGEIRLRCPLARFDQLDHAEETRFLPASNPYSDYGPGQVAFWPYYRLGGQGAMGIGGANLSGGLGGPLGETVVSETLPAGEVAVHRGDRVHAVDGDIGHVRGIVIGQPGHRVTHVLLREGHLFGRKEVAVPASAITGVRDGIELNLTKQEVQDLPPVELVRPAALEEAGEDEPAGRDPLRVRLGRDHRPGSLDGAWWPQSRHLHTEAADLVDHFPRPGEVARLLFSRPDWDATPGVAATPSIQAEHGPVRLGSFPSDDTHVMVVAMSSGERLRLLVIPSDTVPERALRIMEQAVDQHDTRSPAELLGLSGPDQSGIGISAWDDDGGAGL